VVQKLPHDGVAAPATRAPSSARTPRITQTAPPHTTRDDSRTTSAGLPEPLLERELETAHLRRAVDHSWHGVGRLVVEGTPGIGKTSLLGSGP